MIQKTYINEILQQELELKSKLIKVHKQAIEQHNNLRNYVVTKIEASKLLPEDYTTISVYMNGFREYADAIEQVINQIDALLELLKKGGSHNKIIEQQKLIQNNMVVLIDNAVRLWVPLY